MSVDLTLGGHRTTYERGPRCGGRLEAKYLWIWDWGREEPPTEQQMLEVFSKVELDART